MLPSNDDLLVRLFRWAHRQNENFTTEAFAHVLEHLVAVRPVHAARLLSWLVQPRFELSAEELEELEILPQNRSENPEHGIPDLRLVGRDFDIIIEIKLDDSLGPEQTDAYRSELSLSSRPRRALVGLTGRPPPAMLGDDVVLRTWRELGAELENVRRALAADGGRDVSTGIAELELSQFLRLLRHQRLLAAPRVDSPLGEAIELHRQVLEREPSRSSPFNSRVRRIEVFDDWKELAPLRDLLLQVREALIDQGHRVRLESGQSGTYPWIGYTIDDLAYFVEVNLDEPSDVTFTRWAGGVSPSSFDGSLGEVSVERGMHRWSTDLDLADAGYFDADASGQIRILREFFAAALAYAQRLAPASGELDGR